MDVLQNFVVFLTLLVCVMPDDSQPSVKAKAQVSKGDTHLFSGEDVQLTCTIPDDPSSKWLYQWFHDGELKAFSQMLDLNKAQVQHSGNYTCLGKKDILRSPFSVTSLQSDPINVHVDGGWSLLKVPQEAVIVDEAMTLTCRIRDNPLVSEVIFYRDDFEIKRLNTKDFVFPSVTLENAGRYSCRATWFQDYKYHSAMSLTSVVEVLDKVNPPVLEFSTGEIRASFEGGKEVVFRCITKINAKKPGLSLEYYYMKDDEQLGPASSKNIYIIPQVRAEDAGFYRCRVRSRILNLERFSNQAELKVRSHAIRQP